MKPLILLKSFAIGIAVIAGIITGGTLVAWITTATIEVVGIIPFTIIFFGGLVALITFAVYRSKVEDIKNKKEREEYFKQDMDGRRM